MEGYDQRGMPSSILGPLSLNVFINDLFLFIENCALYNNADENSMSYSLTTLQNVLSNLRFDCNIAIDWLDENGMKANPNKFQFMFLSPNASDDIELKFDRNTNLNSERSVKALGVTIDYRLTTWVHAASKLPDNLKHWPEFRNILI